MKPHEKSQPTKNYSCPPQRSARVRVYEVDGVRKRKDGRVPISVGEVIGRKKELSRTEKEEYLASL